MKNIDTSIKQSKENTEYANKIALEEGENNMPTYNKSIVKNFAKFFEIYPEQNLNNPSILEFGAGMGSLLDIFRETYSISPECIEIDSTFLGILQAKKFTVHKDTSSVKRKFDFIYTSNVLEHIEDDFGALVNLRQILLPGGKIAIYVPALPILFSNLDYQAGHFRRYRKQELIAKVQSAGFNVEQCFYNDSLGVPASIALKAFGYRSKFQLGSGRSLEIYDRFIYPMSQVLDTIGLRKILGKNLFLLAKV